MADRETELKLALATADDYERVRDRLPGFEGELEQENRYYDLPGSPLGRSGVLWRLRRTSQGFTLTVKRKAEVEDGYFQSEEHEEPLEDEVGEAIYRDPSRWTTVESGIVTALADEFGPLADVKPWGSMSNRRRRYRLREDVLVELDRTEFGPGDVEWEIEVEHRDPHTVRALLAPYLEGIESHPQTRTKSQRLQARLEAERGSA